MCYRTLVRRQPLLRRSLTEVVPKCRRAIEPSRKWSTGRGPRAGSIRTSARRGDADLGRAVRRGERTRGSRTSRARSRSTPRWRSTTSPARSRTSAAWAGRASWPPTRSTPLVDGLRALADDVAAGRLAWDPALEDVHMNLEAALAERSGRSPASSIPAARGTTRSPRTSGSGRAARSTDLDVALVAFERALVGLAERDGDGRPPRHDPHPAGPAGPARPSPARLRRDARARPRAASPTPAGGSTSRRSAPGRSPAPGYPLDRETTAASSASTA